MKQKDLPLILIVVFVSGVFSFVLSNFLFSGEKNRQEKVEVVQPITADFNQPDKKYFNDQSIDPTKLITIGDNNNNQPFNSN
jgi:hypothetical protein